MNNSCCKRFVFSLIFGVSALFSTSIFAASQKEVYSLAQHGKVAELMLIKQSGASLDAVDAKGRTALCQAIEENNTDAYQVLKAAGADANHKCVRAIADDKYKAFVAQVGGEAGPSFWSGWKPYALGAVAAVGVVAAASSGGGSSGGSDGNAEEESAAKCRNEGFAEAATAVACTQYQERKGCSYNSKYVKCVDKTNQEKCSIDGFTQVAGDCSQYQDFAGSCTFDNTYGKCVDKTNQEKCSIDGFTETSCTQYQNATDCGYDTTYKKCVDKPNQEKCSIDGFTQVAGDCSQYQDFAGSCTFDNTYGKCVDKTNQEKCSIDGFTQVAGDCSQYQDFAGSCTFDNTYGKCVDKTNQEKCSIDGFTQVAGDCSQYQDFAGNCTFDNTYGKCVDKTNQEKCSIDGFTQVAGDCSQYQDFAGSCTFDNTYGKCVDKSNQEKCSIDGFTQVAGDCSQYQDFAGSCTFDNTYGKCVDKTNQEKCSIDGFTETSCTQYQNATDCGYDTTYKKCVDKTNQEKCSIDGFTETSCTQYQDATDCSHDATYKKCVDKTNQEKCSIDGFTETSCTQYQNATDCSYDATYKKCVDKTNQEKCLVDNSSFSDAACAEGYEIDQVCGFDNSYHTCKPSPIDNCRVQSGTQCVECDSGNNYASDGAGKCALCPSGDIVGNVCYPQVDLCETQSGGVCSKCSGNNVLGSDGKCYAPIANCQQQNGGVCQTCVDGYEVSGAACAAAACEGYDYTSCPTGYAVSGTCLSGTVTKLECANCASGYYKDTDDLCKIMNVNNAELTLDAESTEDDTIYGLKYDDGMLIYDGSNDAHLGGVTNGYLFNSLYSPNYYAKYGADTGMSLGNITIDAGGKKAFGLYAVSSGNGIAYNAIALGSGTATGNITMSNAAASTYDMYGINIGGSAEGIAAIYAEKDAANANAASGSANGTITLNQKGSGALYGAYMGASGITASIARAVGDGNAESNIVLNMQNVANTADIYGIYGAGALTAAANSGSGNVVSNLTINHDGLGKVYGLYNAADNTSNSGSGTVASNVNIKVNNQSNAAEIVGLYNSGNAKAASGTASGKLQIVSNGVGKIYGLYKGADYSGSDKLVNAFATGSGNADGIIEINAQNAANTENVYGIYNAYNVAQAAGGTGAVTGTVNVTSAGSGIAYGLYDDSGQIGAVHADAANTNLTGNINLTVSGNGAGYGAYSKAGDNSISGSEEDLVKVAAAVAMAENAVAKSVINVTNTVASSKDMYGVLVGTTSLGLADDALIAALASSANGQDMVAAYAGAEGANAESKITLNQYGSGSVIGFAGGFGAYAGAGSATSELTINQYGNGDVTAIYAGAGTISSNGDVTSNIYVNQYGLGKVYGVSGGYLFIQYPGVVTGTANNLLDIKVLNEQNSSDVYVVYNGVLGIGDNAGIVKVEQHGLGSVYGAYGAAADESSEIYDAIVNIDIVNAQNTAPIYGLYAVNAAKSINDGVIKITSNGLGSVYGAYADAQSKAYNMEKDGKDEVATINIAINNVANTAAIYGLYNAVNSTEPNTSGTAGKGVVNITQNGKGTVYGFYNSVGGKAVAHIPAASGALRGASINSEINLNLNGGGNGFGAYFDNTEEVYYSSAYAELAGTSTEGTTTANSTISVTNKNSDLTMVGVTNKTGLDALGISIDKLVGGIYTTTGEARHAYADKAYSLSNAELTLNQYGSGDVYGAHSVLVVAAMPGSANSQITINQYGGGAVYGIYSGFMQIYAQEEGTSVNSELNINVKNEQNTADIYGFYNVVENYGGNGKQTSNSVINQLGLGKVYGSYNVDLGTVSHVANTGEYKASNMEINIANQQNAADVFGLYNLYGNSWTPDGSDYAADKITADGNVTINHDGLGRVFGMYYDGTEEKIANAGAEKGTANGNLVINVTNKNNAAYVYGAYGIGYNAYGYHSNNEVSIANGKIDISTAGSGKVYGMYGAKNVTNAATADAVGKASGEIRISSKGTGEIFGIYSGQNAINALGNSSGSIVINALNVLSSGNVYGVYGAAFNAKGVENQTTDGRIKITQLGLGDVYGLYHIDNANAVASATGAGNVTGDIGIYMLSDAWAYGVYNAYSGEPDTPIDGLAANALLNSNSTAAAINGSITMAYLSETTKPLYGLYSSFYQEQVHTELPEGSAAVYGRGIAANALAYETTKGTVNGNLTLNYEGSGNVYGLFDGYNAGIWSENSDLDMSAVTAKGVMTINVGEESSGNIYGIYGTGFNAVVSGKGGTIDALLDITQNGSGDVYGIYSKMMAYNTAFSESSTAQHMQGVINITSNGAGKVYGVYGTAGSIVTNSAGGTGIIQITQNGLGTVFGLYGEDGIEVRNSGSDSVTGIVSIVNNTTGSSFGIYGSEDISNYVNDSLSITSAGGLAVGIYADGATTVKNDGTITISGNDSGKAFGIYVKPKDGVTTAVSNTGSIIIDKVAEAYGIYVENTAGSGNVTVTNSGTISLNGVTCSGDCSGASNNGNYIVLNGASLLNVGTLSSTQAIDLAALGGNFVIGQNSKIVAPQISGTALVDSGVIAEGFAKEYTVNEAIVADEISALELRMNSVMAKLELLRQDLRDNVYSIVARMRSFADLAVSGSVADFLQQNYDAQNNESLFNRLKNTSATLAQYRAKEAEVLGYRLIPNFSRENMEVLRSLGKSVSEQLFSVKGEERKIVGYDMVNLDQGTKGNLTGFEAYGNTMYTIADRRMDRNNNRIGAGIAITQFNSSYDDDSTRKNLMVQLLLPVTFEGNQCKMVTTSRLGYARGDYRRQTEDGKLEADTSAMIYGINNEFRYNIDTGWFVLEPAVEANLTGYYQDKIKEKGAADRLILGHTNNLSLEGGLGLYVRKDFELKEGHKLSLRLGAMYYHEFSQPYHTIEAQVQSMRGSYGLRDSEGVYGRDRGVFSARVDYNWGDFSVYGSFNQFVEKENNVSINAGIRYNF